MTLTETCGISFSCVASDNWKSCFFCNVCIAICCTILSDDNLFVLMSWNTCDVSQSFLLVLFFLFNFAIYKVYNSIVLNLKLK